MNWNVCATQWLDMSEVLCGKAKQRPERELMEGQFDVGLLESDVTRQKGRNRKSSQRVG